MTKTAKVSVIIPLYNKEHTIVRAIESVLANRVSDIEVEILVVNDGSTDGSVERVTPFLENGTIALVSQINAGPGSARNHGARITTGEFLAFLDADDEWNPSFLRVGIDALNSDLKCAAFVCGYDAGAFCAARPNKVISLGIKKGPRPAPTAIGGKSLKKMVDAMHSSCIIVRRSTFEAKGGYYASNRCTYGEDSYLWSQILLNYPVHWDPAALSRFHVEDSDLGYAVTKRSVARPLVSDSATVLGLATGENRAAFRQLISEFARADARLLALSGYIVRSTKLRMQYNPLDFFGLIFDLVGFTRYWLRKVR